MTETRNGGCLCGAVRFSAPLRVEDSGVVKTGACHCGMCRRWGSGPFISVMAAGAVSFEGEENIGLHRASGWGERGFCQKCGANLFWRMQDKTMTALSTGAFDDQSGFVLDNEIYVDCAAGFYGFEGDRKRMTEAEVIAAFTGGS